MRKRGIFYLDSMRTGRTTPRPDTRNAQRLSKCPRWSIPILISAAAIAALGMLPLKSDAQIITPIEWGKCPPIQEGFPPGSNQECATVSVPLDYRAPSGAKIDIAISRIKASNPAKRRGVLLLNSGGPGGRGLDMPRFALALFPQSIAETYDLIGFDPRGVGRSAPITCGLTPEQASETFPQLEQDGSFEATATFARDVADGCAASAGPVLPFITTANTARDMDRIRIALGETKVSYFAYSYGAYLGAAYASLFPNRTDRFVLDSAINPDLLWRDQFRSWGAGGEVRFPDFVNFAIANEASVRFGNTPAEVRALYFELIARADANPIDFAGLRVNGPMFRVLSLGFLSNDDSFPVMVALWQAVRDGSTTPAARSSTGAASVLSFPEIPPDNQSVSSGAVLCDDIAWSRSVDQYRDEFAADTQSFPLFGPVGSHIWPCAFWPNEPIEAPVTLSANGPANNILILNTLRDPLTPLPGAQRMREILGQRARLVLVDAGGHAILGLINNECAANTASEFLVGGVVPDDTTCLANPPGATATTAPSAARLEAIRAVLREMLPIPH